MAKPSADDVRNYLDGYGIDHSVLPDLWIESRRDNYIIPYVESITRQKFSGIETITEYYSGTNKNVLMLNRRPIVSIVNIEYVAGGNYYTIINLGNIELIADQGIIKAKSNEAYYLPLFTKGEDNIKITYTYGFADYPANVKEAIICLCAEQLLGFVGARTGGGNLTGKGFSRQYGERGKWQDVRNDLSRSAHMLLYKYITSVVGS